MFLAYLNNPTVVAAFTSPTEDKYQVTASFFQTVMPACSQRWEHHHKIM